MARKLYDPHSMRRCFCCKTTTKHVVYDQGKKIYKCLICGVIR